MEGYKTHQEGEETIKVNKLIAPGEYETISMPKVKMEKLKEIMAKMDGRMQGEDSEGGPTDQDYINTMQYALAHNHGNPEELEISEESAKFIRECGLFLI